MSHGSHTAPHLDQLMAEIDWVRRLARALVKDAAAADDVAQDAWVLAVQHPPAEPRPLRPWLSRVVLNVVRMRHRAATRRDAREAAWQERDVPTPAELVERVELQRAVAGEVLALDEPYRSTVLLAFVEGLPGPEIARRLGVPEGTVRRRLKVAIDRLRDRLAARADRPGRGWLAALAPLVRGPDAGPIAAPIAPLLGAVAMKKLIAVVVLVVLFLLIGAAVWWRHRDVRGAPDGAMLAEHAARPGIPARAPPVAAAVPPWIAQAGVPGRRVAGHVRSADGPVAGARVRLASVAAPGVPDALQPVAEQASGPDGGFDFGVQPAAVFTVSAEAPRLAAASLGVSVADPRATPDQLELRLGACRSRLDGTVLDAAGGGIARARLFSADLGGAEADATGQYSLCMPDHDSVVRVEADGYGTVTLPFHLFGALRRDIVLVPEAVLAGQVVSARGAPVAGARVIAVPDEGGRVHAASARWVATDRDGRFQIAGLAPGRFLLHAIGGGLGTSTPQLAIARPATASSELRLVLDDAFQIRGRVVMAGRPVGGARVAALHTGSPGGVAALSQADGSFVLSGVTPGTTLLVARPYEVVSPTSLEVPHAPVDDLVVEVRALATVHGHVTRHGQPVAGATVTAMRPLLTARTDAGGAFVLEGLAPGNNAILARDLELRAVSADRRVILTAGEDQAIDLELEHAGQVKGTVVDEEGRPVPGVYVRFVPTSRARERGGESITDGSGAFDCGGVPEGDYLPEVYPAPLPSRAFALAAPAEVAPVHVPADGVVTGVPIAIRHERVAIRGRVVDDLGAEVPDVQVEARAGRDYGNMTPPSAITDASGRFEIPGLARGAYTLRARAADGSDAELAGCEAGEPVAITLARPGSIEGTLEGFAATPILELLPDRSGGDAPRRLVADGVRFRAPGLPPGRYRVEARAGADVDGQAIEVRAGEPARVVLRGRGLGRISGRLGELASGAPIAGWRCAAMLSVNGEVSSIPPDGALQATTDATGRFSVAAPLGEVRVSCVPPAPGPLSIAGTDVHVAGPEGATVELIAVRASGSPRGDPGFTLARGVLPVTIASIDPRGPAATAGLAAGDHLLAIDGTSLRGMLPMGAQVLLGDHRPGTTATLAIERAGAARTVPLVLGGPR
ncbi:MAG TPA: sigma-70 family RNA polymerase sigma factor [Kofleriaceae bacterium]|nr:sigma-70 family RNA polymerase sigma factor [Kofleriaceae bacterium]